MIFSLPLISRAKEASDEFCMPIRDIVSLI